MMAVKFPDIKVSFPDGKTMKLPIRISDNAVDSDKLSVPKASLVCLSFRGYSEVIDHGLKAIKELYYVVPCDVWHFISNYLCWF